MRLDPPRSPYFNVYHFNSICKVPLPDSGDQRVDVLEVREGEATFCPLRKSDDVVGQTRCVRVLGLLSAECHKLGGLKQQEFSILILGSGSPKSRCQQAMLPLKP